MGGPTIMRSFVLFEGDRAAMLHIRQDRDVTAFDREDAIRFRVPRDLADDTTWRLRHWAWTGLVQAKDRLIRIDLAGRAGRSLAIWIQRGCRSDML
jgi:hypothetical protein